jgi:hypothetical protein
MKYYVEMRSFTVTYIPRLIKTGSGIPKLLGGRFHTHTHSISLLSFYENKETRLKIYTYNFNIPDMVKLIYSTFYHVTKYFSYSW